MKQRGAGLFTGPVPRKQIGQRRSPAWPTSALVGFYEACLGCHPRPICHIARSHELPDQRLSLIPIVFNDEQCGFHYTISASTLMLKTTRPPFRMLAFG